MISRIRGVVIEIEEFAHHLGVTIDVAGVGYQILVPAWDINGKKSGSEVDLFTDFIVREDSMTLYGFSTSARRSLFRTLQRVSGVGPKLAMTMIASTQTEELIAAIVDSEHKFLESIPGVGKKVAARVVLELREKMNVSAPKGASWRRDISEGLRNLGYSEREADDALSAVVASGITGESDLQGAMKAALAVLNSKRNS